MPDTISISALKALLERHTGCMCSFFEHCELCSSFSQYYRLKEEIWALIYGPEPELTAAGYGKSIQLSRDEIYGSSDPTEQLANFLKS